jgi:hypothetical protein
MLAGRVVDLSQCAVSQDVMRAGNSRSKSVSLKA